MSKKILLISQNFYPEIGSAGNRIKNIYLLLKDRGYDVDVLTTDPTYPNRKLYEDERFWDHEGINTDREHIKRIQVKNKKYSQNIINRLFYYLEITIRMILFVLTHKRQYDIVFVTSPPIFVALVGLLAKYKYRARLILDIRDLWPESLKGVGVFDYPIIIKVFKKIESLLYITADNITVNSKGFIDYIENYPKVEKGSITFIPNGIKENEIRVHDINTKPFKVIYAGNIGLAQDNVVLMDLAKELSKRNISLTIMAYGIKREEFVQFAKEENLTNVHFLKPCNREECFSIIKEHHVGIVTLNESEVFETVLPGKVIDYMACGLPIVASVSGFSKEIIEKQNVGYVSKSRNANDILRSIIELYKKPNLAQKMSLNGTKYVRSQFSWERNIQLLVDIIEEVPQK